MVYILKKRIIVFAFPVNDQIICSCDLLFLTKSKDKMSLLLRSLTRNGSTVTLCDTTWLNGFNFESMTRETPVFAASIALNRVMLGTWADFVSCVGQTCPIPTMDSLSKTGNDSSQNQDTVDPHTVEQIYELANRLLR